MLTFLWVFGPKALFFESIRWCVKTNFLNFFYSESTYFLYASRYYDQRNMCLFYFLYYQYIIVLVDLLRVIHVKILCHFFHRIQSGPSVCEICWSCLYWEQLDMIFCGIYSCLFFWSLLPSHILIKYFADIYFAVVI